MERDMMSTPTQTAEERYRADLAYRQLVELLTSFLFRTEFTPSELREAAILASIHFERLNIRRHHIMLTPEIHRQLDELHRMVSEAPRRD
jgi:hypothetical protein